MAARARSQKFLTPHALEARADVDGRCSLLCGRGRFTGEGRPCCLFEMFGNGLGNKPRAHSVHVPVKAVTPLLMDEKPGAARPSANGPSRASWPHKAGGALPRSLAYCRRLNRMVCSRPHNSGRRQISIPAPWRNEWWKGSSSPRPTKAPRPRRWLTTADRVSVQIKKRWRLG